MDYFQVLLRLSLVAFLLALFSACSGDSDSSEPQFAAVELSDAPLRIIGFTPDTVYYDSPLYINFGASGGTGNYQLRYIKYPELEEEPLNSSLNPMDMYVNDVTASTDDDDAIKPTFELEGILESTGLVSQSGDTSRSVNFSFGLELTDGVNSITETYELKAALNVVHFRDRPRATEATPFESSFNNLLNAYQNGDPAVCSAVGEARIGRKKVDGVYVYPAVYIVQLDAPVSKRTTLYYKTSSSYVDARSERDTSNIRSARPDVDYIAIGEDEGQVVFEAGQSACYVQVDIIDDNIVEEVEKFKIEFTRVEGAALAFSSATTQIELSDNEPDVTIKPIEELTNKGNSFSLPVYINALHPTDIEVSVFVDTEDTTAISSEYALTPSDGVVVIPAGSFNSAVTIDILPDTGLDSPGVDEDKKLVIRTDLDDILELDPTTIAINEWESNEIVASESQGIKAIDFTIDSSGDVITLLSDTSADRETIKFDVRDRTGKSINKDGLSELVISHEELDIKPLFIATDPAKPQNVVVVAQVENAYNDVHYGKSDFVVFTLLNPEEGAFFVESAAQFGTESDDTVTSVKLYDSYVYVSGYTDGLRLNGQAPDIANKGGVDGFVYKIGLSSGEVAWSRFVGTVEDDNLVSVDVGRRELLYLLSLDQDSLNGKTGVMSNTTKLDRQNVVAPEINTIFDDYVRSISYDSNASRFYVLADGNGLGTSGGTQNSSLSQDVNVHLYNSELTYDGTITVSSLGEDVSTVMATTPEDDIILVGGYTDNNFEGEVSAGGIDAFIAVMSKSGSSSRQTLASVVQFGTAGSDKVIDIEQFSEDKFLVLWSETNSEQTDLTYRVSAFSMDGEMLSIPLE